MCCREPSPVLLREDRPTISCVPDNVLNPTNTTCVDVQHRPRMSICWSIRLIVRLSAEQHEKPDAPCRVRRRVGPVRHRHWRAYPSRGYSKTRATLKSARSSVACVNWRDDARAHFQIRDQT